MPTVIESFHAFSDKEVSEESLIALPVSESTQDEGVLEDESEYTDDHNEEVEVSEDNEKEVAAAQNDEMETTVGVSGQSPKKGQRGEQEKKDAHGLLNNIIEETTSKLAESRKSKVKALVGAFKNISLRRKTLFHVIKKMVVSFTINTGLSLCGSTNENIDILLIEVYLLAKMSAANVVHLQQGWNCVRNSNPRGF
ncbi:ribonuclease H-like domain-containing protein [Tanacetum coccineum]